MINWRETITGCVWIIGLAIALAAVSYHGAWRANHPGTQRIPRAEAAWLGAGTSIFCAGLALAGEQTWEIALWAALGALCLVFTAFRLAGKDKEIL